MKKLTIVIALICAFSIVFAFVSCGQPDEVHATGGMNYNYSWGYGSYGYYHICVTAGADHSCFDIVRWYGDDSLGLEVKTESGKFIYISEGSYIMFSDKETCPFCK